MRHQRALDETEKQERRRQILAGAAALFEDSTFDQVSMAEVARRSGVAKGTLYLYFAAKEELFLALLEDALFGWFAALEPLIEDLPAAPPAKQIDALAAALTGALEENALLLRLLPILHVVLEHNIPYPAALGFKRGLRDGLAATGARIEARLAFLNAGQGGELLLNAYAGLIGLQSMTQTAPVVRQVLEEPGLELLKIDGALALRQMIRRMLLGYWIENRGNHEIIGIEG